MKSEAKYIHAVAPTTTTTATTTRTFSAIISLAGLVTYIHS